MTILTALLVVFTALLAVAGIWQAAEIRRNSNRQLRAYLGVDEMDAPESRHISNIVSGTMWAVSAAACLKNYGKTPAYHVQVKYAVRYAVAPLESDFEIRANQNESGTVLQPGQSIVLAGGATDPFGRDSFNQTMDKIKNSLGSERVFVSGMIKYIDAFGQRHYTKFCFSIDYRNGPQSPPGWDLYRQYNETDDQPHIEHCNARLPLNWVVGFVCKIFSKP